VAPAARAASISTVKEVETDPDEGTFTFRFVSFEAKRHERIRARVTRSGRTYTFRSAAGPLDAGDGCRQRGRRRVVCRTSPKLDAILAELSSRNDRFVMATGRLPSVGVSVAGGAGDDVIHGPDFRDPADGPGRTSGGELGLDGGSGDDTIVGGNGSDVLRGGGGRDRMIGRRGADIFEDNDLDRDHFDRDVYRGGRGRDLVSYSGRARRVSVDLGRHRGGQKRERDAISGIEDVEGGDGGDSLTGDRRANHLDGGIGDDTLRGGRGDDRLDGGAADFGGSDRFSGGPGNDRFSTSDFGFAEAGERVSCGSGDDLIVSSDDIDLMAADCELAGLPVEDNSAGTLTVNPRVTGNRATFRLDCTRPAGSRCAGNLAVGSASTAFDAAPGRSDVTVVLSPADASQLSSRGSLVARIAVTGGGLDAGWSATLRR
jgi:hypothetical protein